MYVSGHPDQRIAAIAARQRGRLRRDQLLAAGITDRMIHGRLASGALRRLHPGVYAVGPPLHIPLADETAALLACGEGAVLSHHAAAALWEIVPRSLRETRRPIDVTVTARQTGRPAGVRVHRTRQLRPSDTRISNALPLTSPSRTILDIAEDVPTRELERIVDEALVRRLVTERQLERAVQVAPGHRGAAALGTLLTNRAGATLTRSAAEELCLSLIRKAQLPEPEVNVRVRGFLVDFYWRELGLVVEIDGYTYHSTRSAFERDRRKDATLKAAGLTVTRATWRQLNDEPFAVIARLAQALAWEAFRRHGALVTQAVPPER